MYQREESKVKVILNKVIFFTFFTALLPKIIVYWYINYYIEGLLSPLD